jgi:hypothetical protein
MSKEREAISTGKEANFFNLLLLLLLLLYKVLDKNDPFINNLVSKSKKRGSGDWCVCVGEVKK